LNHKWGTGTTAGGLAVILVLIGALGIAGDGRLFLMTNATAMSEAPMFKNAEGYSMKQKLMIGFWRCILNVPSFLWKKQIFKAKKKFETELAFMSEEHRLVHHFVVKELTYVSKPLSPNFVANKLRLAVDRVNIILDDLEQHMTFIFRNSLKEVVWAYPVTVEKTPHHLTFHTEEQLYAA